MADLLKILKGRQAVTTPASAVDTASPLAQSGTGSTAEDEQGAAFSPRFEQAEDVAQVTAEMLDRRGWCLWRCSALDGEVIAVAVDEGVEGVPEGYPVYTEQELAELCRESTSDTTLRLVHEAKKLAGARVATRVKPKLEEKELNSRFLLAVQPYVPKVGIALIRECREDIELFGLEYAQRKWANFVRTEDKEATAQGCN